MTSASLENQKLQKFGKNRTVVSEIGVNSKVGRSRGSGKGHPTGFIIMCLRTGPQKNNWARRSAFATSELALTPFPSRSGMFSLPPYARDFGQLLRFFPPHVAAVRFVVKQVSLSLQVMPLLFPEHACVSKSSVIRASDLLGGLVA